MLLLLACTSSPEHLTLDHADLVVSPSAVDLGATVVGEPASGTFTVENAGGVPMGFEVTADEGFEVSAEDADCASEGRLEPGCAQTWTVTATPAGAGTTLGSVLVRTLQGEGEDPTTRPNADPDDAWAFVDLSVTGRLNQGKVALDPRSVDFGYVWPGDTETATILVTNAGDGPLVLYAPVPLNCGDGFDFTESWSFGEELQAGGAAYVVASFSPQDFDGSVCALQVATDDADFADLDVNLQANRNDPAPNTAPTVTILSPAPLTHVPGSSFTMELLLDDVEQPPDTLQCQISSANLLNATLEGCTPDDDSGQITVEVQTNGFPDGTDTIQVTVRDNQDAWTMVSLPLLMDISQPGDDDDDDGYGDADDCDDADGSSYPHATELEDGKDNDCDSQVDEDTPASDDDLDGFSENEGDCNDADGGSYPGAPEVLDGRDNDCDDVVDDGTLVYDDDGDGAALDDCDDEDPEVYPNAPERCNGRDDDCNGKIDDACVETTTEPLVVHGVLAQPSAVGPGGSLVVSMEVVDDQDLSWSWSATDGTFADAFAAEATWTAPETLGTVTITGRARDADDNEVWAFADVEVVDEDDLLGWTQAAPSEGGCSTAPVGALWLLGLVAAVSRSRG